MCSCGQARVSSERTMELQALFSRWAKARIWSSTCIRLLPISTSISDNCNTYSTQKFYNNIRLEKSHYTHIMWRVSLTYFPQVSDILHKLFHYLRYIQHIDRVSKPCSLQGVGAHLMSHSDSVGCIDGPLQGRREPAVRSLIIFRLGINIPLWNSAMCPQIRPQKTIDFSHHSIRYHQSPCFSKILSIFTYKKFNIILIKNKPR